MLANARIIDILPIRRRGASLDFWLLTFDSFFMTRGIRLGHMGFRFYRSFSMSSISMRVVRYCQMGCSVYCPEFSEDVPDQNALAAAQRTSCAG
jgi:hypothetical protein